MLLKSRPSQQELKANVEIVLLANMSQPFPLLALFEHLSSMSHAIKAGMACLRASNRGVNVRHKLQPSGLDGGCIFCLLLRACDLCDVDGLCYVSGYEMQERRARNHESGFGPDGHGSHIHTHIQYQPCRARTCINMLKS